VVSVRFSIFDSFDLGDRPDAGVVLAERLEFAVAAEALGIDHYHVTEHHGTPLSVCPSPNIWLAALSQRTARMRLGALVNVLPAHDPLRLAEEIAALDHLTGGRLDVGVGSGVSPYELAHFGVAAEQAKAIYAEALEAITGGWRTGRLSHRGILLRSYDAQLSVLPKQRPYPPLWYASSNTKTARWAGEHGVNFVGRWNGGGLGAAVEEYWSAWESHRDAPGRLNGHVEHPLVGLAASVVIAGSDAEAEETYLRAHAVFGRQLTQLWHEHGNHQVDRMADGAGALRAGAACVGSVATVREQVLHQLRSTGANFFQMQVFFGDLTVPEAHRTLRTFMTEVAPVLRSELSPAGPGVRTDGRESA
jgi:alkanesulfonate monooxygenase SsuD/methylene tetrahydromethanopterin reductase-like flavin-dependent oxidoreductase (luciferase family)